MSRHPFFVIGYIIDIWTYFWPLSFWNHKRGHQKCTQWQTEYKVVHGIPDSISTFMIDTISKFKNNNNESSSGVLKNIFSFVPKSLKKEYTVVLVGDRRVGRGEFVKALRDLFNCDPVFDHSTNKTEVTLRMDTNYGATTFNIHVFHGLEWYWNDGLRHSFYFLADC